MRRDLPARVGATPAPNPRPRTPAHQRGFTASGSTGTPAAPLRPAPLTVFRCGVLSADRPLRYDRPTQEVDVAVVVTGTPPMLTVRVALGLAGKATMTTLPKWAASGDVQFYESDESTGMTGKISIGQAEVDGSDISDQWFQVPADNAYPLQLQAPREIKRERSATVIYLAGGAANGFAHIALRVG